jgi:hypothetical protein
MGWITDKQAERRAHPRVGVEVPVVINYGDAVLHSHSQDLSAGGICVAHSGDAPAIGECVEMSVDLPGRAEPAQIEAEVRWTAPGKLGLMFRSGARSAVAAFVAALLGSTAAQAASKSAVPEFDPNADTVLDMEAGGERPDDYAVLQAFEQQFGAFDQCVDKAKRGKDVQLPGDVDVQVLLDPKGERPLGINATLPNKVQKDQSLRECLRSAIAAADYPAYKGVPVVVEFSFQLDPGYTIEEASESEW